MRPPRQPLSASSEEAALRALAAALAGDSTAFFEQAAAIESPAELAELASAAKALSELAATLERIRRPRT